MKVVRLASAIVVTALALVSTARAQQLLSGLTGAQCSARGGQITTWTSTAGRGPSVGDCYIAPRSGGGRSGGFTGGGGGTLGALGAGLQFLDALSNFVDTLPSNDEPAANMQPAYDYTQTPEYQEMQRQQKALQSALSRETDDLQAFVRGARPSATATASADLCKAYEQDQSNLSHCYQTAAAALEQQAAKCNSESCRATMLRAAASARCVAALAPSPTAVSATIAKCGKDPASGLQRVAATGASQASGAATPTNAPAKQASAQQAGAQGKGWVAPGSAAECQKLAQSSIARNTAAYYDLCVSDPPSRSALKTTNARAPDKRAAVVMPPPSPLTEPGCSWYGGSLRPDGSCWIIGVTTNDCNDMHGRVTEDSGYKYCFLGGGPGDNAPRIAVASNSSPAPSTASPSDDALDQCRDGAIAPWTIAGCYDLLGQPAAQNRPGALRAKLRESLESYMRAARAAEQQRDEQAEEAAAQARLYRDWRSDAVRRYDRWVAEHHEFVAEDTAARDSCTGRWTFDGTSPGSCDPGQSRARWELTFETRQPPSEAEAEHVAASNLPWRTNSESDCRNAGGIPIRPLGYGDITGLPPQLLDDPTVDQDALRRSWMCYQTLGRTH